MGPGEVFTPRNRTDNQGDKPKIPTELKNSVVAREDLASLKVIKEIEEKYGVNIDPNKKQVTINNKPYFIAQDDGDILYINESGGFFAVDFRDSTTIGFGDEVYIIAKLGGEIVLLDTEYNIFGDGYSKIVPEIVKIDGKSAIQIKKPGSQFYENVVLGERDDWGLYVSQNPHDIGSRKKYPKTNYNDTLVPKQSGDIDKEVIDEEIIVNPEQESLRVVLSKDFNALDAFKTQHNLGFFTSTAPYYDKEGNIYIPVFFNGLIKKEDRRFISLSKDKSFPSSIEAYYLGNRKSKTHMSHLGGGIFIKSTHTPVPRSKPGRAEKVPILENQVGTDTIKVGSDFPLPIQKPTGRSIPITLPRPKPRRDTEKLEVVTKAESFTTHLPKRKNQTEVIPSDTTVSSGVVEKNARDKRIPTAEEFRSDWEKENNFFKNIVSGAYHIDYNNPIFDRGYIYYNVSIAQGNQNVVKQMRLDGVEK